MTNPRRCSATITGLANLSHPGSLASSDILLLSFPGTPLDPFCMKGAPLRQAAQLSGLHLFHDPAHPLQLGLSQHQLVLRLYEEETGQVVLLHGIVKPESHLPSLLFQKRHSLLEKRNSLLGKKPGQKRE